MQILQVAFSLPLRREFDYLPAKNSSLLAQVGVRVRANFGNRSLVGLIVDIKTTSDFPLAKLKNISEILDPEPILSQQDLDWLKSIATYYHAAFGEVIFMSLPKLIRIGRDFFPPTDKIWRLTTSGKNLDLNDLSRTPKQIEAIKILQKFERGLSRIMLKAQGVSIGILKKLEQKNLIVEDFPLSDSGVGLPKPAQAPFTFDEQVLNETPHKLNDEQKNAVEQIKSALGSFEAFLLLGITGSGKTEVYLQVIFEALKQGKQTLLLVPEINLTPQTLKRFSDRFNCKIGIIHSGLTDSARLKTYLEAKTGEARIVIGTRSAVFTQLANPGIILLDEEQDTSFKQQDTIRYNARDLAVSLARRWQVPLVLGSATPSLSSLLRAYRNTYKLLRLSQRHTQSKNAPKPQLLDTAKVKLDAGVAPFVFGKIKQHLQMGNQVLLSLNRRGFAPLLKCLSCNWQADCPNCDTSLIYHQSLNLLWCHHCDYKQAVPTHCEVCGNDNLSTLGVGTEKTQEVLQKYFADYPVIRIDRDTTKGKELYAKLDLINQNQPAILLGTQMLAKGHHFPKVSLSVILDADFGLLSSDPYALEKTAQLITQVAGRAGRGEVEGEVFVQTAYPDDFRLQTLCDKGYEELCKQILAEREGIDYPPFGAQVLFRLNAIELQDAQFLADEIASFAMTHKFVQSEEVLCLGPIPAPMERRQNRYHIQVLLQSKYRSKLHSVVEFILQNVETKSTKATKNARLGLDIDPIDLF